MLIQGTLEEYYCRRAEAGYTYMQVHIYRLIPVEIFGWRIFTWKKKVWASAGSRPHSWRAARLYTPGQCRNWFREVVKEYEDYTIAWRREIEGQARPVSGFARLVQKIKQ